MPEIINRSELREAFYEFGFLDHLVTEECFTARLLLEVLDKPERWQEQYEQFRRGEPIDD